MAHELHPTIILQSLVMPDIDDFELLQSYKQHESTKDTPIIVLSSSDKAVIKAKAFEMGASDYLIKLPEQIELLARIRYHNHTSIEHMELQLALQELAYISNTDGLTGIANRRSFDQRLSDEWKRSIRNNHNLSIALMDIDFFKQFNDNYGHQAGDDCLINVAQCLNDHIRRPPDLAARYGGEEFVVILPETSLQDADIVAEMLRGQIEDLNIPHAYSQACQHISVSIGVASVIPSSDLSLEQLIKAADEHLYQAKDGGRNQISSCQL
ncbi:MAG: diguanylate cyclase [Mariprofundaceae bacterium]